MPDIDLETISPSGLDASDAVVLRRGAGPYEVALVVLQDELDTKAGKNDANTWGAVQAGLVNPLVDGATINTNGQWGNEFTVTLAGNRTLANPTNLYEGAIYTWVVKQDAIGGRSLAFGSAFKFVNDAAPTLDGTPNSVTLITAQCDGTYLRATALGPFST